MPTCRQNVLCVFLLFSISIAGCYRAGPNKANNSRAAYALFDEFETVFFAKAEAVSGSGHYSQLSTMGAGTIRQPFWFLMSALDSLGQDAKTRLIDSADAFLVGAKDFRSPSGLGPVRSQNCYVVVLRNPSSFELKQYFRGAPKIRVGESQVWNWSAYLGEFGELDKKPSSLYATQIGKSYVMLSNKLEDLEIAAKQLAAGDHAAQGISKLKDWELVQQYEVWGYRRYRHENLVDRTAAGMSHITNGAQALLFTFDWKQNKFRIRLHCVPGEESTPSKINSLAIFGRLKALGGGVWEKVLPIVGGEEDTLERLASVMDLLGFGVYV